MSSKNSEPGDGAPIASPCRRQCCLDAQDVCLGCGRSLAQILEWGQATEARRRLICTEAEARLRDRPR